MIQMIFHLYFQITKYIKIKVKMIKIIEMRRSHQCQHQSHVLRKLSLFCQSSKKKIHHGAHTLKVMFYLVPNLLYPTFRKLLITNKVFLNLLCLSSGCKQIFVTGQEIIVLTTSYRKNCD